MGDGMSEEWPGTSSEWMAIDHPLSRAEREELQRWSALTTTAALARIMGIHAERDALLAQRGRMRKAILLALFYLVGEEADEVRAALTEEDRVGLLDVGVEV
jgi:hypothetical protein